MHLIEPTCHTLMLLPGPICGRRQCTIAAPSAVLFTRTKTLRTKREFPSTDSPGRVKMEVIGARMAGLRAALLLMTMASGCAFAQRHGSSAPPTAQKQSNPVLSINTTSLKTWNYFQLSTLLKMDRIAVGIVDPKTNLKNVYEGVPLKELVPGLLRYQLEVYRDFWAFKDKRVLLGASRSAQSDVIVADTINGKRLRTDHPFCLIARNDRGDPIVVSNLAFIRLTGTQ